MTRLRSIVRTVKTLALAVLVWVTAVGPALAQPPKEPKTEGGSWVLSYALVLMCVVLGLLVVLKSSRRRERAKPEQYGANRLLDQQ